MTFARIRPPWWLLAACLALTGCKSVPELPGVTPYRMDIQQGNYVSQDMVDQLKPGMSREQVRFVLGTPLVTDIFHSDRWDYVYYREPARGKREQRRLVVRFENDKLKSVEGEAAPAVVPPPPAAAAKPAPVPEAVAKPAPEAPQASAPQGGNWQAASDVAAKPAPAAEPVEAKAEPAPAPENAAPSERGFFGRLIDKLGF